MDNGGKPKKIVYGKLRHAPGIIGCLDAQRLIAQDDGLKRFVEMVAAMKEQVVSSSLM